jgi:uncharacterized coiled-coil DUF342 family protein
MFHEVDKWRDRPDWAKEIRKVRKVLGEKSKDRCAAPLTERRIEVVLKARSIIEKFRNYSSLSAAEVFLLFLPFRRSYC